MIRIDDDFYIDVDAYNYTAKVDKHKTYTDKYGKIQDAYDFVGHYSNLAQAIKGILDYKVRYLLADGEKTLVEALQIVTEVYKEFDNLCRKVMADDK